MRPVPQVGARLGPRLIDVNGEAALHELGGSGKADRTGANDGDGQGVIVHCRTLSGMTW
jgi:hypothetical protein